MCFGSSSPPPTPDPAPAPPAPALPASQAASPSQQIGFARKAENKKRFGKTSGQRSRREEGASNTSTTGDTGAGLRM